MNYEPDKTERLFSLPDQLWLQRKKQKEDAERVLNKLTWQDYEFLKSIKVKW